MQEFSVDKCTKLWGVLFEARDKSLLLGDAAADLIR